MTRKEELREAYRNKTLEVKNQHTLKWEDWDSGYEPAFILTLNQYRIKPTVTKKAIMHATYTITVLDSGYLLTEENGNVHIATSLNGYDEFSLNRIITRLRVDSALQPEQSS
jgi:hypothetical protein